jgi:hypothetical protein
VEAEVELAVAGSGEPLADNISGRDVYRSAAGVGGEGGGGAETIDRAYPAKDFAGRQRADTAQVGQSGAGVGDCGLYVCGGLGDAAVQLAYLRDQVLTVTGDADDAVTVVADGSDVKKTLSA